MRGIEKVVFGLFDLHGEDVDFEVAVKACEEQGLSLQLGTFRANKSLWKKMQSMKSKVAVPETVPVTSVVVQDEPVSENFQSDELKAYFVPPKVDDTHVINKDLAVLFDALDKMSVKKPVNVRLNGPAGCGKTTTAMEFAARFRRPMLVMNCSMVREPRDWFGFKDFDPKTQTISWKKSLFYKFVQTNNAVVVLDEMNRISPMVLNTLLPLLDDRRKAYLEEASETIKVGNGVVFFATTNEGREFTGTVGLDLAQADRMSTLIEVTYLPEEEEAKLLVARTGLDLANATKLAQVAGVVRKKAQQDAVDGFSKAITTRILLNAAELMVLGGTSTLRFSLLSHYSPDGGEQSERGNLLKLLVGKFGSL